MKSDREKVRSILIETIVALCNKGLKYNMEMSVEGLLGITLDRRDVFLINIREVINTATGRKSGFGPGRPSLQAKRAAQAKKAALNRKRKLVDPQSIPNYLAVARDGGMATTSIPQINELNLERQPLPEGADAGAVVERRSTSLAAPEVSSMADRRESLDLPSDEEGSDLRDIMMLAMKRQENKATGQQQQQQQQQAPVVDPLTGEMTSVMEGGHPSFPAEGEAADSKEPLPLPSADSMEAPSEMVEFVNEIVAAGYQHRRHKKKKRGHYNIYTADQRARIGQYAAEHGIMPAVRKFKTEFNRPLQDSSVRAMRKAYLEARKHLPDDDVEVTELPTKERGRPLMLGEYDAEVVEYVEALKRNGVQINHQIVMDAARGVLLHHDKNKLKEFGGPVAITRKWAESFIRRIRRWSEVGEEPPEGPEPGTPGKRGRKKKNQVDGQPGQVVPGAEQQLQQGVQIQQHQAQQQPQPHEQHHDPARSTPLQMAQHPQHPESVFSLAPTVLTPSTVHTTHQYHTVTQSLEALPPHIVPQSAAGMAMPQTSHDVMRQNIVLPPHAQICPPPLPHMISAHQMTPLTQMGQPTHAHSHSHSQMPS